MQSVIRVGAAAGVLGCLSMYLVAREGALVVSLGLVVLGLAAGLAMAKWLEWSWYGRQLEAGLKAGAAACVPAGLVALVALLVQGPHTLPELAASSHLGPISASGLAYALGFGGWVSADLFGVALSAALGVLLAGAAGLFCAWSKSARTVQQVTQAHEAAQTLRRGAWGPSSPTTQVPAFPSSLAAGPAWQGATTNVPAAGQTIPWASAAPNPTSPPRPSFGPSPAYVPQPVAQPVTASAGPAGTPGVDPMLPLPGQPPANTPTNDDELRAAMREALAMWGDDTGETPAVAGEAEMPDFSQSGEMDGAEVVEQPTERRKRSSKASQFLNDKKRGRKKSDTRDWLC